MVVVTVVARIMTIVILMVVVKVVVIVAYNISGKRRPRISGGGSGPRRSNLAAGVVR